ncbi:copper resistance protein CopC [Acinetobacter baumannii]|uniref:copper resistance CopC family protein n=1 Tax=Acinetobacter TaxID=469 RepID=UPI00146400B0|nr:copper resistance CopC family protein [Acinetobacter baumannii]MCG5961067.1 copper resistance protein CopC [Acinetobacter baumannii]QJP36170.1 copper resistance protein CopC [Acinetobacter baumannii]
MTLFQNWMIKLGQILAGIAIITVTTATFAHVNLLSSTPAANAVVAHQPKKITLNFADAVMLMNIKLVDAQKKEIPLNYKVSHDLKKSFDIALPKLSNGKYTVFWMTMAKDGHHMNGEYSFTIKNSK